MSGCLFNSVGSFAEVKNVCPALFSTMYVSRQLALSAGFQLVLLYLCCKYSQEASRLCGIEMCLHIPVDTHRLSIPEMKRPQTSLGETSLLLSFIYFPLVFLQFAHSEWTASLRLLIYFVGKCKTSAGFLLHRPAVTPQLLLLLPLED